MKLTRAEIQKRIAEGMGWTNIIKWDDGTITGRTPHDWRRRDLPKYWRDGEAMREAIRALSKEQRHGLLCILRHEVDMSDPWIGIAHLALTAPAKPLYDAFCTLMGWEEVEG